MRRRCSRWSLLVLLASRHVFHGRRSANEWIALHLYQRVANADLIIIATIVDAPNGIVRVDETLKGSSPSTIRLIETVDPFAGAENQKPLVNGNRELMFLNRKDEGHAPQQILLGRWKIAGAVFADTPKRYGAGCCVLPAKNS